MNAQVARLLTAFDNASLTCLSADFWKVVSNLRAAFNSGIPLMANDQVVVDMWEQILEHYEDLSVSCQTSEFFDAVDVFVATFESQYVSVIDPVSFLKPFGVVHKAGAVPKTDTVKEDKPSSVSEAFDAFANKIKDAILPKVGSIVMVYGVYFNGTEDHPAIITRATAPGLVNVTLVPDGADPYPIGGVKLYQTRKEAVDANNNSVDSNVDSPVTAYWPDSSVNSASDVIVCNDATKENKPCEDTDDDITIVNTVDGSYVFFGKSLVYVTGQGFHGMARDAGGNIRQFFLASTDLRNIRSVDGRCRWPAQS